VQVYINIWPQHVQLVRDNSHFWNASGIQVEAGLFSGVDINTESVESILSGGVAFSTPDNAGDPAKEGQHFKLADNP
jgi:paraquat-inducible protein B